METSFELGTIRGIRIGANWSLLVVFALIAWTLADGIFPDQNPGLSDGTYIAMAVVAAALFFASILAHELGHAFQALREGMEIDGITLWLFGGVAKFRGEFPSAGGEFRIAIAGPVVSLVIGLGCVGIAQLGLPDAADGVAAWLGYINLLLLVFNLLPALPLDGGRVLRSLLWKSRGDFLWATRVSTLIGQGLAYLMIAGGVFLFIFQSAFSGAWLAFIGWFLLMAARDERRYAETRATFGGLSVADVMVRNPVTVEARATLGSFVDGLAWGQRFTTYPVLENGRAVGLLPFRRLTEAPRESWEARRAGDCMLALDRVPRFRADQPAVTAASELAATDVNRGLVLDGDRLVGLVSITDLLRTLQAGPGGRRARESSEARIRA